MSNAAFLRNEATNSAGTTYFTGDGYLVYGLAAPQGTLSLSNVASVIQGGVPNTTGITADQIADANATTRLANVDVIKGNSFAVTLDTNKVILTNNQDSSFSFHDHDADGDNALIMMDSGIDLNGNGTVDFRTPGSDSYGFEKFTTVDQDGYDSADNNGTYTQNISTAGLSEGYHYIDIRALPPSFRRRRCDLDGFSPDDLRRSPPAGQRFSSETPWDTTNPQNINFNIQSVDQTATDVHMFLNLPSTLTDGRYWRWSTATTIHRRLM